MPSTTPRGVRAGSLVSFLMALVVALFAAPLLVASNATAADSDTCEDIITGEGWDEKVEGDFDDGDPALTVTAPEGFLIDKYCVKTGSSNQGDGPVIVDVNPPAETVTIDHPTKEGVSHFMVHLIEAPEVCPEGTDNAGQVIPEGETVASFCNEPDEPEVCPEGTDNAGQEIPEGETVASFCNDEVVIPPGPINPPAPPAPGPPQANPPATGPVLPSTGVEDYLGGLALLGGLMLAAGSALLRRSRKVGVPTA
jgi:LPXTG-motif cell wall-anchored protein